MPLLQWCWQSFFELFSSVLVEQRQCRYGVKNVANMQMTIFHRNVNGCFRNEAGVYFFLNQKRLVAKIFNNYYYAPLVCDSVRSTQQLWTFKAQNPQLWPGGAGCMKCLPPERVPNFKNGACNLDCIITPFARYSFWNLQGRYSQILQKDSENIEFLCNTNRISLKMRSR